MQMHRYNSFITLTYDDEHLPENGALRHRDYVLFMKALRNLLCRSVCNGDANNTALLHSSHEQRAIVTAYDIVKAYKYAPRIRFYMGGEYGETYGRPHYHAILFGLDFGDKTYHGKTKAGEKIYLSATLQKLWKHGYSSIGTASFASAAYIARYIMKKRTGDGNKLNYEILDLDTGELVIKPKEYNCMSRAHGIGKTWLMQYHKDVYTTDNVITKKGTKLRPPRYYDKQYKKMDAAHLQQIKHIRELEALEHQQDHTPERLAVQETVANAKARFQTRNLPG